MAKKPVDRDDLMLRTRAARDYCNRANDSEEVELAAFMAIFHPKTFADPKKMQPLLQDARERRRRRYS